MCVCVGGVTVLGENGGGGRWGDGFSNLGEEVTTDVDLE